LDDLGARGWARGALQVAVGVVGVLALAHPLAQADEPAFDPMWRSPWAFSIGAGVIPLAVAMHTPVNEAPCATPDGSPCSEDYSMTWSGIGLDVSGWSTVYRAPGDAWSFEVGPQFALMIRSGDGWFVNDGDENLPNLYGALGANAAFRFRPHPPPIPGSGRGSLEWALRTGLLATLALNGLELTWTAEVWAGWSLPARVHEPTPEGAAGRRRTAAVLGPYVRGAVGSKFSVHYGPHWRIETGIRIDVRRETRMPPSGA